MPTPDAERTNGTRHKPAATTTSCKLADHWQTFVPTATIPPYRLVGGISSLKGFLAGGRYRI
jgi:hypothetical protein